MSFLLKAGIRLDDLTPAEAARIAYEDVILLRRELFARVIATVEDGPVVRLGDGPAQSCGAHVQAWAARMTAKHGRPHVTVHQTPELPWATALMVVMWGEAPLADDGAGGWRRVWPAEWTPSLVARALAWEDETKVPAAVTGRNLIDAGGRRLLLTADLSTPTAE